MPNALPTQLFPTRQLVSDPVELITFEVDAGFDRGQPDAVFFPESTEDVSRLMRWAHTNRVPLVARGAGTGLSGGAVAERGGIIVEFARLHHILELDRTGRNGVVEPGVVNLTLDSAAKAQGLYYPPDPSSGRSSVIGGNLGENAGGPHCFKYGVTTNYITGLEAVLADGTVVTTGGRALDYPEYDLTGLIVGSEGTLALATRAYVRLMRNPPAVRTMMVSFHSDEEAGAAVSAIIAAGLVPATLEMMDQKVMGMIEDYVQIGLPVNAQAALIVEVDGHPDSLDSQMEEIADILATHGGYDLRLAQNEEERQRIWYGRKSAAGAFARLAPAFYLVDVTVPRSLLAETLHTIGEVLARYELETGHVFHAGDGNLHPCILCDPRDKGQMERVFAATREIVAICVDKDGSITGEHGVGIEKREFMPHMYTGAELAAMHDVKEAFDPDQLLNPGKILPDVLPAAEHQRGQAPSGDVFAPQSAEEAAGALAACSAAGRSVRIGSAAEGDRRGASCWLSTKQLQGVRTFAPDDLYVTVGAGTALAELNTYLAAHNMLAPLSTPWPGATVGGLLAANINGPLRLKYGGWRDNLLCATVALADGRVIRAGRPVVKNVAGYDLPKLLVGSRGTLGLLTDVTLKLTPLPRAERTLQLPVDDIIQGVAWAQATANRWLATAGVVLAPTPPPAKTPYTLLFTLEGLPEDVEAETAEITQTLRDAGAPAPQVTDGPTAIAIWSEFVGGAGADECVVRAGVPPQHLRLYWSMVPHEIRRATAWLFDMANGHVYARSRCGGAIPAHRWLDTLRQPALALRGYAVALHLPAQLHAGLDPWGYRPDGLPVMRRIKARWDPAGILNPGEFVV